MKENVHTAPKHPRGSSPPENVEEIYRAWLQRPAVSRDEQLPAIPPVPIPDKTGSDVPGAAFENPAGPARQ